MATTYRGLDALKTEFASKERQIRSRLEEFHRLGRRPDRELFLELCFCLLAIQTKARVSDAAVRGLLAEDLLWSGDERSIARWLRHRVRFHNHKASYLVRARDRFFVEGKPVLRAALDRFPSPEAARAWLVAEVAGLGMKEASHFLRNIGRGETLAILDRHVLRNLVRHHVIARVPTTLTPRRYIAIEARMHRFAEHVGLSVAALDLLLWSRETGEIFK